MTDTDATAADAGAAIRDPLETARRSILAEARLDAPFDGWTQALIDAAAARAGVDPSTATLAFPRGGVDLALFFHREGDQEMLRRMAAAPLGEMRIRERVAFGVRTRLEIAEPDREAVRRATAMYALPAYAPDGARALWETADHIWTTLGDASEDLNWYSKRAILSGVLSATLLYWLGDQSEGRVSSWAFLDRRIEGVMRFEKLKAQVAENPLGRLAMMAPNWVASQIRKPGARPVETGTPSDLPGGSG